MAPGKASGSARERARALLTADIKQEARRQLATTGADALSLRAVARELGMASSALYRYFPSKYELLTALIIDAYNAVGEIAEQVAGAAGLPPRARWLAMCRAIRDWARRDPHQYALIYGSPVPGYRAPDATIGPASRVPRALIGLLGEAGQLPGSFGSEKTGCRERASASEQTGTAAVTPALAGQAAAVAELLGGTVRPDVLLRGVLAWTQLFGMISFELSGQFTGSFEPADDLFDYAMSQMCLVVGL